MTTTIEALRSAARHRPEHEAVVYPNARLTYAQLSTRADSQALHLAAHGVECGDHVAILMVNGVDAIVSFFAVAAAGAVPVLLNPRYRPRELVDVVERSHASVLLVGERTEDLDLPLRVSEAFPALSYVDDPHLIFLDNAPRLRLVMTRGADASVGFVDLDPPSPPQPRPALSSTPSGAANTAVIMYTSGTTALPKGVVVSQRALMGSCTALGRDRYDLQPSDRLWDPLPLCHMGGLMPLLTAMCAEATFLGSPRVDAEENMLTIERERATVAFAGFPLVLIDIFDRPDYREDALASLRIVHTNGSRPVIERIHRELPRAVQLNTYGLTETIGLVSTSRADDSPEHRSSYSGQVFDGLDVRIVDEGGVTVPEGTLGEIVVRGYALFDCYYCDPESTTAAVDSQAGSGRATSDPCTRVLISDMSRDARTCSRWVARMSPPPRSRPCWQAIPLWNVCGRRQARSEAR